MTLPAAQPEVDINLPRRFGAWTGMLVTVASMVGVGILTTSGYTIQATESASTLLFVWALGGVLSLCGALTYAELATRLPRAGGDYVFVREAYGDGVGFTYGWATFLLGFAGPTALIGHACVVYLLMPFQRHVVSQGGHWPTWITPLGASVIILALMALHCRGHRASAWVQNLTTAFKFLLLSGFVVAGLWTSDNWSQLSSGRTLGEQDVGTVIVSLIYVFYAYLGWNGSVYLAGEIDEPRRTLPRAVLGGCAAVTVLYLLLNVTYVLGVGVEGLRDATPAEVEAIAETAGRRLFGPRISSALSLLIGCGILASVSAYLLTGSRVCFAMACDGLYPAYAARLSRQTQTPVAAIVTLGLTATVLLWASYLAVGAADAFRSLLNSTTVGLVLLTSLGVSSLFVLRSQVRSSGGFSVPWYPLPPLLFLAITSVLMYHAIQMNPGASLWGTAAALSGGVVWGIGRLASRLGRR